MRKELKDAIELARRFLSEKDANLAIFCVTDFPESEEVCDGREHGLRRVQ